MAKIKTIPLPPDLKDSEVGEIHRLAAAGDNETTDSDWDPGSESSPLDEKKNKKEKKKSPEPKTQRPRQPIEIRAGKIHKEIFCHFTYDQNFTNFVSNDMTCKSGIPIHEDMRPAFNRLIPHLAAIFEEIDGDQFLTATQWDPEDKPLDLAALIASFSIIGFRLEEYDEEETIVLIGERLLECGPAKLETPPILFSNSVYAHIQELRIDIDAVIYEILEYLHGRKRAPEAQLDMFTQANN